MEFFPRKKKNPPAVIIHITKLVFRAKVMLATIN